MSTSNRSFLTNSIQCYTIRVADPSDAEEALKLFRQVRSESPYLLLGPEEGINSVISQQQQFMKMQSGQNQIIYLAFFLSEPVGFIGISRGSFAKIRHSASIAIAVAKAHQQKGVARQLMQSAFEWALQVGVRRLELSVLTENDKAISLYQHFGFYVEGTKKMSFCKDGQLVDEFSMAKILDPEVS